MNGNKILDHIKAECDENIRKIEAQASDICSKILADSREKANQITSDISEKTDIKLKQLKANSKSRIEIETKNTLLRRKRSEIDITLDKILEYLLKLSDSDYFDVIYKLSSKLSNKNGEIYLNSRDISRLPSDFEKKLRVNGLSVKLGRTPVDIQGGFILRYGNIEENMDFSAIISAKKDKLEDLINRELFSSWGGE